MPASWIRFRLRQWRSKSALAGLPAAVRCASCFRRPAMVDAGSVSARTAISSSVSPGLGMFGPVHTFGCALTSAMYSSSTSRSRTVCTKPSMPARSRSLASASADVRLRCASVSMPCLCASSMMRAVDLGLELRHGAIAVVHPDLHEVDLAREELAHVLPPFVGRGRAVRNAQTRLACRPAPSAWPRSPCRRSGTSRRSASRCRAARRPRPDWPRAPCSWPPRCRSRRSAAADRSGCRGCSSPWCCCRPSR